MVDTATTPRKRRRSSEDVEHVDVLIVGAGLSGIGAAHHLQTDCPWASYAIFEARDAIGGTWDLFRYPGIRSDSDMFTLGYRFRPWDGPRAIADGESIRKYIVDTATEAGIDSKIRFHHRVVSADWSSEDAHWKVTAERTDTGDTVELTCGFLFSCAGYYRYDHGHDPDFAGRDRFKGQIVHPQDWPEDLDYAGKRIVVIGSGATAVTLIPSLAPDAAHVTMLQRSPTYMLTLPHDNPLIGLARTLLPSALSGEAIRWFYALSTQAIYFLSQWQPQAVRTLIRRSVTQQLPKGFDVDTHFNPSYDPWDQRMCIVPGGDLFESIRDGKASIVTDRVDTFTEDGIRLESGDEIEADIIVTATGLEMLFAGGMDVSVDGDAVDLPERLVYKGMMIEDVPNFALAMGYTNASWMLKCELITEYVMRLLNRMHETGERQCTPHNDDRSIVAEDLLGLSSGYVQRAAALLPKAGSRFPWRVYQSYVHDYRATRGSDVDDGVMVFSNPAPAASVRELEAATAH